MNGKEIVLGAATCVGGLGLAVMMAWAQHSGGRSMPMPGGGTMPGAQMIQQRPGQPPGQGDHGAHGTPEGWKFTLPKGGDPVRGREAFVKFECFTCHEVKGERFPAPDPGKVGPELSAMAQAHPPEYFAEAIINPSAVIDKGRGYEGPDGSSKMPSFNDDLTVRDLVDLVAYLMSLKPPAATGPAPSTPAAGGHRGH